MLVDWEAEVPLDIVVDVPLDKVDVSVLVDWDLEVLGVDEVIELVDWELVVLVDKDVEVPDW